MKLLHYTLRGFTPFIFSKIKELDLSYPEDVEVILGNNGCGKSSYLRTLTPYPLPRSMFQKNGVDGYRELVLEHDGHVYRLISDYSNKASPHQFIKDEEGNLNDGGTTGVQCELIETHLGLTSQTESLLFGSIDFCGMKPGEVKPFLMKICPLNLGWILEDQKKTSSILRNIKAELKYLTTRETQLLSEMMSKEDLDTVKANKDNLHKAITKLIGEKSAYTTNIENVTEVINKLLEACKAVSPKSKIELLQLMTEVEKDLKSSSNYELLSLTTGIAPEDYSKHEYEKQALEKSISDIIVKLDDIEKSLKKSESENIEELTASITSDKNRSLEIEDQIIKDPLSKEEVGELKAVLDKLTDLLTFISKMNDGKHIWTRRHLRCKEDIYRRICNRMDSHSYNVTTLENHANKLEKEIYSGWTPDISPCAGSKCLLYVLATSKLNERKESLKAMKADIAKSNHFINRYKNYIVKRGDDLKLREEIGKALDKLRDMAVRDCPPLLKFIRRADLLEILAVNPYKLIRDIEETSRLSLLTDEYNSLIKRIRENEAHLKTVDKLSESYKKYLLDDKDKLTTSLNILNIKYKHSSNVCRSIAHRLAIKDNETKISEYTNQILKLEELENEIKSNEEKKSKFIESRILVDRNLSTAMEKLTRIEMILSAQEKISSRYEEEVKARKDDLEKRSLHFTDMEYAMIELSKRYMRNWLEALVEQVNTFIAVVWNQPLELVIPKDDKDYKFTARFKGEEVESLSLCSSAMTDIINLCVCLALRSPVASADGVGMRGYPLSLDETGRTFDDAHKSNLIDLFNLLLQDGLVSQIFLASHHAVIHGALTNIQTLVLNSDNIAVPANYNQEVNITYY